MFKFEFFIEDKHVLELMRLLAGRAHNLNVVPVINAQARNGVVRARTSGAGYQLLVDYMREHKMDTITGPQAKSMMTELGMNPTSYSHHLNEAVRHKLLKKGKNAHGTVPMTYQLVLLREDKS